MFDRAGGRLLPTRNHQTHGSIGSSLTVSSKTNDSVSGSDRRSHNCRRVPAIASRWSVRTGRTPGGHTGFLTTIGSAKQRFSPAISMRHAIEFGRHPVRCWRCTTRQGFRASGTTSKPSVRLGSIFHRILEIFAVIAESLLPESRLFRRGIGCSLTSAPFSSLPNASPRLPLGSGQRRCRAFTAHWFDDG